MTQNFADHAGSHAFQITTNDSSEGSDLAREAQAILEFVDDRHVTKLTIVGHSQGGAKAVHVIDLLQKMRPEVEIRGLILLEPVGLYEQTPGELTRGFLSDTLVGTPKDYATHPSAALGALQTGTDVIFNVLRAAGASGTAYSEQLKSQIREMARAHPEYQQVRCPVVLVQGTLDPISSPEKVMPSEIDPKNLTARSELLKEELFPNSPRVDMLMPEKLGHHVMPLVRSEQIAKTSLYLLEREERRQK